MLAYCVIMLPRKFENNRCLTLLREFSLKLDALGNEVRDVCKNLGFIWLPSLPAALRLGQIS